MSEFVCNEPCGENVYVFNSCPPSRHFQAPGNQSLSADIRAVGLPDDWFCGRSSGLKLKDTPRVLTSNVTGNLEDGFAISLWFRPQNTTLQELQTILTITEPSDDENEFDGCRGNALQLGQYGNHVLLRYRDSSKLCRVVLIREENLKENIMTNVVLMANQKELQLVLNGRMQAQLDVLDLTSTIITQKERHLILFGSRDNDVDHFRGSLYRLSFVKDLQLGNEAKSTDETNLEEFCACPIFNVTNVPDPETLVIPQGSNESHVLPIIFPDMHAVKLRVKALPNKGLLQVDGKEIHVDSDLDISTKLDYTLTDTNFFNSPHINVHGVDSRFPQESFAFQIQFFDDDGYLVGESRVLQMQVFVQLMNHPPHLVAPKQASPLKNDWIISGIDVEDSLDHDMNYVRVEVASRRGRVSVSSEDAKTLLKQYECSGRSASPWQCVGDGYQDRRLTFVAAPSDVKVILQNLKYQALALARPEADNVTVTIYDGIENDCLTRAEHWSYQESLGNRFPSLHPNGCVSVQAVVEIPGFTVEASSGYGPGDEPTSGALPDLLFWLIFIVTLTCFCWSRLKKCARRGSAVEADNEDCDIPRVHTQGDDFPSDVSIDSSLYWDEISVI